MTNDELIIDSLEHMKCQGYVAYWNGALIKPGNKIFYIRKGDLINQIKRRLRWVFNKDLKNSVHLTPAEVQHELDILIKAGALIIKQL